MTQPCAPPPRTGPPQPWFGPQLSAFTLALCCGAFALGAWPQSPGTPVDSEREDDVTVRLGEVQILVTDRDGKPILDLKPSEVEVREAGSARKLYALEPFATRDVSSEVMPQPTPLVGQRVPDQPAVVLPPKPIRRIVFLFDAFNSRTPDRAKWVEAARQWVGKELRPSDTIAIAMLTRGEVRLVLPFTTERILIEGVLSNSGFLDSIDYYDSLDEMRNLMSDLETCDRAYDPGNCARTASQAYIHGWRERALNTIGSLQRFSASLAAIPGRKAVLYMSDGVVQDPGETALQAILGRYGTDQVDQTQLRGTMRRSMHQDLQALNRAAAGANVTFFSFDTRPASRSEIAGQAEQREALSERMQGDPFRGIFLSTRGSLDALAIGTGGRAYHGPQILKNLPQAAAAIEGLYTVTFYRDPTAGSEPKIKLKIARKGAQVTFPDKYDPRRRTPLTVPLEVAVGKPQPYEDRWSMPVAIQTSLVTLPYAKDQESGKHTVQLGIFAEANAPDGTRGGEAYDLVESALDDRQFDTRGGKVFMHTLALRIRPGSYRLRVRLADTTSRIVSERAIDVTLLPSGQVIGGIQELGGNQEGEHPPASSTDSSPASPQSK